MNTFNYVLLKEYRKKTKLTQADASKKIGVARTTYADYENGKIQPPLDKINKICEWLDVPLKEFIKEEEKPKSRLETLVETERFIQYCQSSITVLENYKDFVNLNEAIDNTSLTFDEKMFLRNVVNFIQLRYATND